MSKQTDEKVSLQVDGKKVISISESKIAESKEYKEERFELKSEEKGRKDNDVKDNEIDFTPNPIIVTINSITFTPGGVVNLLDALRIRMNFSLDRDAVAAYWIVKFLVDSTNNRIIKILGLTEVEDYPEGESDMNFECSHIDITGIKPSALTNSGLLMCQLFVDGEEVASVNMVVNVTTVNGTIMREILSPLE